ncbi:MAG: metallophosphoesterase family protein [Nanoarchaeota archaeon]
MKILAFTDVHGSIKELNKLKKKSKSADFICCCGDFTIFETNLLKILEKINSFNKKIFLIAGNHEDPKTIEVFSELFENIIFLNNSYYLYKDILILGAEGNGFATIDNEFKKTANYFKKIIKKINPKKIILITHAPPYKTKHDKIDNYYNGNKTIRKFIEEIKPLYAFSGHIHENFNTTDKIKNTITINPGFTGRIINI